LSRLSNFLQVEDGSLQKIKVTAKQTHAVEDQLATRLLNEVHGSLPLAIPPTVFGLPSWGSFMTYVDSLRTPRCSSKEGSFTLEIDGN